MRIRVFVWYIVTYIAAIKIIATFLPKNLVKQKIVSNFALANGGIAQLVRASDS